MPPAAVEEGEDASGSRRTRSAKRGRSESLESEPAAWHGRGRKRGKREEASSTTATDVTLMETSSTAGAMCLRSKKKVGGGGSDVKERPRKKGPKAVDDSDDGGSEADKRNLEGEKTDEENLSSTPSSPLCEPYIPRNVIGHDSDGVEINQPIDSKTFRAYEASDAKFRKKLARKMKLPTLHWSLPKTCFGDPITLHLHESAKKPVLSAAKFVFSLTSSIGGKPLAQCTGFLVEWDEKKETCILLTSADLIRVKNPSLDTWLCKDEYAPDAKVTLHFMDKTTEKVQLVYIQKHYNIALFKSNKVKFSSDIPFFSKDISCGQELFILGRDDDLNLRISYGRVQYSNPSLYERYHFIHTYSESSVPKCANGGLVIEVGGNVIGMAKPNKKGSFVPTSIILNWLNLWRTHKCIPRPHLGLKLLSIEYLDPAQIERIEFRCDTCQGLIVKEVCHGSFAEKVGIRVGDIIEFLNGEHVLSTVQLEKMLLDLSEKHLSRRNEHASKLDIEVGIFRTRIRKRSTIKMTLNVTDEGELVIRGSKPVTTENGVSASVLLEQVDPGSSGTPDSNGERTPV